jgi:hypothetical protein
VEESFSRDPVIPVAILREFQPQADTDFNQRKDADERTRIKG